MTKKEKIMTALLVVLILFCVFIILLVISNKEEDTPPEVPNNVLSVENYLKIEDINTEEYTDVFKEINLKRVIFKNINNELVTDFNNKQDELINSLNQNKSYILEYNQNNNITDYKPNSVIFNNILYELDNNILSVLSYVREKIDYKEESSYINNILIDIKNNKLLTNNEFLDNYNISKEVIVNDLFNEIKSNITQSSKTEEEYKNLLIDNFDDYAYLYIYKGTDNVNNFYMKYNLNQVLNILLEQELENSSEYTTMKITKN